MQHLQMWRIALGLRERTYSVPSGRGQARMVGATTLAWSKERQAFLVYTKQNLLGSTSSVQDVPCSLVQAEKLLLQSKCVISQCIALPFGANVVLKQGVCQSRWYMICASRSACGERRLDWQFYSPTGRAQELVFKGDLLVSLLQSLTKMKPEQIRYKLYN